MRLSAKGKLKSFKRQKLPRRPKRYQSQYVGELVGLDTIERRLGDSIGYIIIYIDEHSGYAIALAMDKQTSNHDEVVLYKVFSLNPFAVKQVINDNGSEFRGAFAKASNEADITYYHNYPNNTENGRHL